MIRFPTAVVAAMAVLTSFCPVVEPDDAIANAGALRFSKSLVKRRNLLVLPRRPNTSDMRLLLSFAHDVGYARGLADHHTEERNFTTGAEWLSWLRG